MSTAKYITIGAGVIAVGAALYFLSQDDSNVNFKPDEHTLEKLKQITHELFVEGATLYCQKLHQIR